MHLLGFLRDNVLSFPPSGELLRRFYGTFTVCIILVDFDGGFVLKGSCGSGFLLLRVKRFADLNR